MLEEYEINSATLAILSVDAKTTKVIEEEGEYLVAKSGLSVMNDSCQYFGSSFLGREAGARHLIGSSYKAPIIVEETRRMIFIPTSSPKFSLCDWIAYQHIHHYEQKGETTMIVFDNGKFVEVKISKHSFENQILRAMKLENTLRNRIRS